MTESTRELFENRERNGIIVTLGAKLFAITLTILVQFFFSHSHEERSHTLAFLIPIALITLALLKLIKTHGKKPTVIGLFSVFLDCAVIVMMPLIWYLQDKTLIELSASVLDSGIIYLIVLFIALNTLGIQPLYPLVLTQLSVAYLVINILVSSGAEIPDRNVTARLFPLWTGLVWCVGMMLTYVCHSMRKNLVASIKTEVRNSQLARYFSPNVAAAINREDDDFFSPGGKTQNVAVMFTDIRSFTRLTDTYPQEMIFSMLRDYHSFMVRAILDHGGTLDKFIGDGILATFGTPFPGDKDATNAVRAALAMRSELAEFNRERERNALFAVSHGIGIHYGPALVGNIGVRERLEYTVIGDTVNTASRVQELTKALSCDILISREVAAALPPDIPAAFAGDKKIRGKEEPFTLYRV